MNSRQVLFLRAILMAGVAVFILVLPLFVPVSSDGRIWHPVLVIGIGLWSLLLFRQAKTAGPTRLELLAAEEEKVLGPQKAKRIRFISAICVFVLLGLALASVLAEVGPGRWLVRAQDRLIGGHNIFLSTLLVFFLEVGGILAAAWMFRAISGKTVPGLFAPGRSVDHKKKTNEGGGPR